MEPDTWEMFGQSNVCLVLFIMYLQLARRAQLVFWVEVGSQSWHVVKSFKATCAHQHRVNMKYLHLLVYDQGLFGCWTGLLCSITVGSYLTPLCIRSIIGPGDDRQSGFRHMSLMT